MSTDGYTRAWLLTAQRAVKTNNKGLAEFALKKAIDGPCRSNDTDRVSCVTQTMPDTSHIGHNSPFTGGEKE